MAHLVEAVYITASCQVLVQSFLMHLAQPQLMIVSLTEVVDVNPYSRLTVSKLPPSDDVKNDVIMPLFFVL